MKLNRYTTLAALALLTTAASHGAVITAASATDSSHFVGGSGSAEDRGAFNTINGGGLSGIGAVETQLHNQYANPGTVGQTGGMWLTNGTVAETITFDLGSIQTIDKLFVWNYAERVYNTDGTLAFEGTGRGVQGFTLLADNTATPTTVIGSFSLLQAATTTSIGIAGSPATNAFGTDFTEGAQTITLSAPITAQFIRFSVTSNYGGSPTAIGYTGLSEVRFNAVPEASSCALLGLGLLGLVSRRRRNA